MHVLNNSLPTCAQSRGRDTPQLRQSDDSAQVDTLTQRYSDESDTADTEDEFDIGRGWFSHSRHFLPHAVMHFKKQVMFGGHHAFYDTSLSEYSHIRTIKWAGSRVRKRDANTTHMDMLWLIWEHDIFSSIARRHRACKRVYLRRNSSVTVDTVQLSMPIQAMQYSPRKFVHNDIPITWAEAFSLVLAAFGRAKKRSRATVQHERTQLQKLTWTWMRRHVTFRGEIKRVFTTGDVVRFDGTEKARGKPETALVGKVYPNKFTCYITALGVSHCIDKPDVDSVLSSVGRIYF